MKVKYIKNFFNYLLNKGKEQIIANNEVVYTYKFKDYLFVGSLTNEIIIFKELEERLEKLGTINIDNKSLTLEFPSELENIKRIITEKGKIYE